MSTPRPLTSSSVALRWASPLSTSSLSSWKSAYSRGLAPAAAGSSAKAIRTAVVSVVRRIRRDESRVPLATRGRRGVAVAAPASVRRAALSRSRNGNRDVDIPDRGGRDLALRGQRQCRGRRDRHGRPDPDRGGDHRPRHLPGDRVHGDGRSPAPPGRLPDATALRTRSTRSYHREYNGSSGGPG